MPNPFFERSIVILAQTVDLIEQLKRTDWFSNAGMPLDDATVGLVGSWQQAAELKKGMPWENTCIDAQNALTVRLHLEHNDRYQNWNDLIHTVNDLLMPSLERELQDVACRYPTVRQLADEIKLELRLACVETDYADLVEAGSYTEVAKWYMRGRFPCGWMGCWPQGRLMIL